MPIIHENGFIEAEWQHCIECGEWVFTISSPGSTICDNCNPPPECHTDRDTYKKKQINESIRKRVFERDNFTCKICGCKSNLTVDHIVPEIRGGGLEDDNLQTLCKSCNSRKGAR